MGNNSKYGKSWIGGPQHEMRPLRIPGYQGHVRGMISENVHGNSFASVTSKCIRGKVQAGAPSAAEQFITSNLKQFSPKKHRRFANYVKAEPSPEYY